MSHSVTTVHKQQTPPAPPATGQTEKKKKTALPSLASVMGETSLVSEAVAPGTSFKRTTTRQPKPRDADQRKLDADGKRLYEAWIKAGKPTDEDKCPKIRYVVAPAAEKVFIAYLRRVVGPGGPLKGKQLKYVKEPHESGKTALLVIYRDYPPKTEDKK